jgi:hypothetical protein
VAAGVLSIPAGLIQAFKIQAFTGEPSDSSRILTIIGPTVIDGAECVARALDRERLEHVLHHSNLPVLLVP